MNVPEVHPYECNKIIPQPLSRIQKLETLVISLMSERITKIGSNRDHSQLASNEIKSDYEGFNTLIRLSPEEAEYNNSSVLAKSTVTNEDINISKKRKRATKKRQNRRTSKGNEEAEILQSPWAFPNTSIDGTSTVDDDLPNFRSTGYDKPGASKDEQADCKASEDAILPYAGIYSSAPKRNLTPKMRT